MEFTESYYKARLSVINSLWTNINIIDFQIERFKNYSKRNELLQKTERFYSLRKVINRYFTKRYNLTTKDGEEILKAFNELRTNEPEVLVQLMNETNEEFKKNVNSLMKFNKEILISFEETWADYLNVKDEFEIVNVIKAKEIANNNKDFEMDDEKFKELQFFIFRYNLDFNFGEITGFTNFRNFEIDLIKARLEILKVYDIYKEEAEFLQKYDGFTLKENNESEFKTNVEKWEYMFKVSEILSKCLKDGVISKPNQYLNLTNSLF